MKKSILKWKILFVCMFIYSLAHAGTEIQNGGRTEVAEFKSLASEVIYSFETSVLLDKREIFVTDFLETVNKSVVNCESDLFINGEPKDAINYPMRNPQLIKLDCKKWPNLSLLNKYRLAIHEFLFLVGVDDSTYEFSRILVKEFFKNSEQQSFASGKLLHAITICDVEGANESLSFGANIYYRNNLGYTPIRVALETTCLPMIEQLIEMGVRVDDEVMLIEALQYSLTDEVHVVCDSIQGNCRELTRDEANALKVKVLKIILKHFPEITKLKIENVNHFYLTSSTTAYGRIRKCILGNSLLHIVAAGRNTSLFSEMTHLGFSPFEKNSCDQTPVDLLNE